MSKEVVIGATDNSLFCVLDAVGTPVDADALPVINQVFVNGAAVATPVPTIAQALDTGAVPVVGNYFISTDVTGLAAEDQVMITFNATVGGLVRTGKICFTVIDRAQSLPSIVVC